MTDGALTLPALPSLSQETRQFLYRLVAVVAIGFALSLISEAFLTWSNLVNVLRQASLVFFMALGLTLVVLTGKIDLSLGANVGLSACLAGLVIQGTGSPVLGAATGIGVGALIGVLNGLMVTRLRIPSFIATYGTLWMVQGLTYYVMGGRTVHGFPPEFRALGSGYALGLPIPVWMMLGFLTVGVLLTGRSVFGQQIYAIGANPTAARLSGIPVVRNLVAVFLISGAMAGLASLIFLARLNSAEGDIGETLTLPAVAAVLIGGTSLFGGVGSVVGTFIGAVILTLTLNGMNLLMIDANWQPVVTGAIVILVVWFDMRSRRSN